MIQRYSKHTLYTMRIPRTIVYMISTYAAYYSYRQISVSDSIGLQSIVNPKVDAIIPSVRSESEVTKSIINTARGGSIFTDIAESNNNYNILEVEGVQDVNELVSSANTIITDLETSLTLDTYMSTEKEQINEVASENTENTENTDLHANEILQEDQQKVIETANFSQIPRASGETIPNKAAKTQIPSQSSIIIRNEVSAISSDRDATQQATDTIGNASIYDTHHYHIAESDPNIRLLDNRTTTLLIGCFTTAGPRETVRRANTRKTFGRLLPPDVRLVFVLHKKWAKVKSYAHVYDEARLYNDMFFLEGEENMNEGKTYNWFHSVYHQLRAEGESVRYVMKADTDSFININALLPWLVDTVKNPVTQPAIFGCYYIWGITEWVKFPAPEGLQSGPYMNGGGYGISYASLEFIATTPSVATNMTGYEDKITGLWMNSLGGKCLWHDMEPRNGFVDKAWIPRGPYYRLALTNNTKVVHSVKTQTLFDGVARAVSDFVLGSKVEDCTYMGMELRDGRCKPTPAEEFYKPIPADNPLGFRYPDKLTRRNPWVK